MRPLVLFAVIGLSACAAAPRPACGCLPPRPDPVEPVLVLSPESEALMVMEVLDSGCRGGGTPSSVSGPARSAGWIRFIPAGSQGVCTVEVDGPPERIAAVDAALLTWGRTLELTWNVRDTYPLWENGRRTVRRVRGEHGQGEPEMSWTFVEFETPDSEVTTLRIAWDAR